LFGSSLRRRQAVRALLLVSVRRWVITDGRPSLLHVEELCKPVAISKSTRRETRTKTGTGFLKQK
jgi:hypothetical protein